METGMEEEDSMSEHLRDRFRLSTISIAEAEGQLSSYSLHFQACLVLESTGERESIILRLLNSMPGRTFHICVDLLYF